MKHPNIHSLFGIDKKLYEELGAICLVCPLMRRGTLWQYIHVDEYNASTDREPLVSLKSFSRAIADGVLFCLLVA